MPMDPQVIEAKVEFRDLVMGYYDELPEVLSDSPSFFDTGAWRSPEHRAAPHPPLRLRWEDSQDQEQDRHGTLSVSAPHVARSSGEVLLTQDERSGAAVELRMVDEWRPLDRLLIMANLGAARRGDEVDPALVRRDEADVLALVRGTPGIEVSKKRFTLARHASRKVQSFGQLRMLVEVAVTEKLADERRITDLLRDLQPAPRLTRGDWRRPAALAAIHARRVFRTPGDLRRLMASMIRVLRHAYVMSDTLSVRTMHFLEDMHGVRYDDLLTTLKALDQGMRLGYRATSGDRRVEGMLYGIREVVSVMARRHGWETSARYLDEPEDLRVGLRSAFVTLAQHGTDHGVGTRGGVSSPSGMVDWVASVGRGWSR